MGWILTPFAVQGLALFFDEFYFHRKRGLPRWERIGHPIDTLSTVVCYLYVLNVSFSIEKMKIFIALALFSCLLITKDEFVHTKECSGGENWLHAVLFVLHPISLLAAGTLWQQGSVEAMRILFAQACVISLFMIYQILAWGIFWNKR